MILIEYLHIFLVGVWTLLKARLHVYKLLETLEAGAGSVKVATEDGVFEIVLVLLDEELQTNGVAELLELRPSQLLLLIAVELLKHRLELLVQLRVNHAAGDVDGHFWGLLDSVPRLDKYIR